ncbi:MULTISPECIES: glycosyltransferase family 2 protein [Micromonospora]|uniref:Glycosyltransferase family 2 protein n=1 Tax=Micromonospora solifontis TaxID=2487138 RepID=A0ABX9WG71_9ACTN|nr:MULTISPECIES: glycosyltransferase family 2 protein [Micromonospora]NES15543.1 glycosyltransferase family 2 protein [Micromonospora sp. PPF5-17B]NES36887.1 glycosyltransferase family 2 protein [Micromonospora solifontis]NES55230.1 glycosyltransferase family 2 protein [Micromonospora sp. PPF5-6]RNL98937.1 glycosyltransferase family 2 protein [Micromonospora solifontis]
MTNEPEIEVTVLLPCLDEAETLEVCVRKALRSLAECGVVGEVLVSDNGSTDGSQEIAERAGARVVPAPVRGYGGALLGGIERARGRYVIMADADDSYALSELRPFIEALRAGHDVVMGNRFRGGIARGAMPPLHRYLGNPVLSWLGRRLFGLARVGDFHCGMRGFNADRIRALGLCMPGMEFASELVVRAALAGYDIVEVPTTLSPDGRSRPPHLRTWRDGWRHLRFLLVFAPRTTLVRPGFVIALLGLLGVGALTPGPVDLGRVELDVNSLVYACLMVLVGAQLAIFGGLAEIYGRQERLVPRRSADRWIRFLRLETSVTVGLLLLAAGTAGTVGAVWHWGLDGFADLDPHTTLRVVLPSATAVALGVVVLCSGLVGSLLTLRPAQSGPVLVRQPGPERQPEPAGRP